MAARILTALTLTVILSACGGGGGDAPASPSGQPACQPVPVVRIQLYGDSTMHGYDGAKFDTLAVHTPRVNLQAYFDTLYPGKVLVTDRAVSGTTAANLLAGTDGLNRQWPQEVAAEIVVINFGINDRNQYNDADQYRANLRALSSPARVLWQTPNIVKSFDIAPYAQVMREVAAERGQPVADVYAYTSALPNWQALIPDNAHPSEELYQMISRDVVAPKLQPLVAALLCR